MVKKEVFFFRCLVTLRIAAIEIFGFQVCVCERKDEIFGLILVQCNGIILRL